MVSRIKSPFLQQDRMREAEKIFGRSRLVEVPPVVTSNQPEMVTSSVTSNPEPEVVQPASKLVTIEDVTSNQTKRRGNRSAKSKVQYNNRIDEEVFKIFKHFRADYGMTQQEFAEVSGLFYIQAVTSNQHSSDASLLAHDDRRKMMVWNTNLNIINLYLEYNPKNKWTAKDDRRACPYNEADIRIIECGIIDTQLNKGVEKRIYTFDYYRGQIDAWIEDMAAGQEDHLLAIFRRRWAKAKAGEKPWEEKGK